MSGNPMQRPNLPQFVNRMPAPPQQAPWWNNSPQQRMSSPAGMGTGLGFPPNMAPPGAPMGLFPGAGAANFDPTNPQLHGQEFAGMFGHNSFPMTQQQPRIPQQEQQPSQFTKEVQEEANGYFQQLYSETGAMSVSQFIEKLKAFKNSENQKDQEILSCVLKNLFDEYRFFHEYPERALRITAEVYGGIIRESLLPSMMQLATAVRRIIQSLQQKEHGSPLYTFGTLSLYACKSCLHRYPKLCQIILGLDNFHMFTPALKDYINFGAQGKLPSTHSITEQREAATPSPWAIGAPLHHPSLPPGPINAMPGQQQPPIGQLASSALAVGGRGAGLPADATVFSGLPGIGGAIPPLGTTPPTTTGPSQSPGGQIRSGSSMLNATNVDVLMNATDREGSRVPQPPPSIVERVSFLCNNLSQVNLRQKTEEIKVLIRECGENFLRWFAQYLVMKRVTLEQNFQPLYNSFLLNISDENLDRFVKQETFRNIKILLRSDKGNAASNFGDRQLLKNLGLWLGQMTIARNKPILARDLDLKCLLFEAFYKGQQELLYVVPFVAKTLLSCTKSELFVPTCAWIYSIIKVLAEIHNEPDLKLNLKFEIEVLCKDLGIDLVQIEPTGVLKDSERLLRVPQQLGELPPLIQPDSGSQLSLPSGIPTTINSSMYYYPSASELSGSLDWYYLNNSFESQTTALSAISVSATSRPTYDLYLSLQQFPYLSAPPQSTLAQKINQAIHRQQSKVGLSGAGLSRPVKLSHPVVENLECESGAASGRTSANLLPPTAVTPVNELLQDQAKQGQTSTQPVTSIFLTSNFNYADINVASLDGLAQHISIPLTLQLFNTYPELKAAVRPAINQAVKELIGAIAERAISVAIAVTEQVCKKDFALDPNPQHLRKGAHQMARSMTAAMAWITCREPLQNTILNYLKHYFTTHLQQSASNPEMAKLVDETVLQTMDANIELATNFIVKTACEQAMLEVDKRFDKELTARQAAGGKGVFGGEEKVKIQQQMPESIRVNQGPISEESMKIYDDYSAKICGFKPIKDIEESIFRGAQPQVPTTTPLGHFPTQLFQNTRPSGSTTSGALPPNFPGQFATGQRLPIESMFPQNSRMQSTTPTLGPDVNQAFIEHLRNNNRVLNTTPGLSSQGSGQQVIDPQQNQFMDQLRGKVELVVREWMAICFSSVTQQDPRRALAHIVQSMHREGILMTDETVTKFFQIYVNICVDVTHRLLNSDSQGGQISVRHRCYLTLDAFTKLTCLMVRFSDGPQHSTRINLLKKVLNIVTQALHHSHENRRGEFDGMPFMRIILNLFSNLARVNDPILDPISWSILECFGHALFVTQPRRAPGFTFHWLTIIGHRDFIGRLLADEQQDPHRTGAMYTQLLLCHIKFLAPYLRNLPLPASIQTLLKGTLRVLLVILHDFPELLCEYHYVFCDYIPPDCIQLRNLILSAYPRNMRLPDPFNESMDIIENLPDMAMNPKAHREMATIIQAPELKAKLDEYLETRSAVNFLSELPSYLQVSQIPGAKYNAPLVNAVVLYVGTKAIDALQEKKQKISIQTVAHTPYMDIFQNLAVSLCTEGRHLLFNSIANQLRYPNSHTHYFSCTMLYLFLEANLEVIQEQITRILFQRLVALRPHPWGLLITFVELIRNPQYGFWAHEFIRCAPEIEQLFVSVANSCNVNPQQILAQNNTNLTKQRA